MLLMLSCEFKLFLSYLNNNFYKVHAIQNYVDNHQIDSHEYHSIENSRFSEKNVGLSFLKCSCQKLWGFKVLSHFGGMIPLKSKYFIEEVTKPPSYIYILDRRLILYKVVYKKTTLEL